MVVLINCVHTVNHLKGESLPLLNFSYSLLLQQPWQILSKCKAITWWFQQERKASDPSKILWTQSIMNLCHSDVFTAILGPSRILAEETATNLCNRKGPVKFQAVLLWLVETLMIISHWNHLVVRTWLHHFRITLLPVLRSYRKQA